MTVVVHVSSRTAGRRHEFLCAWEGERGPWGGRERDCQKASATGILAESCEISSPQPLVGAIASPSVLRVISDDLPGTLSAQEGPPLTPDR